MDAKARRVAGEVIRTARLIAKLSYRKLAMLSGITAPAISMIEKGQHSPTIETVRKLKRHIAIDVNKLFDLAEEAVKEKGVDDR